MLNVAVRCTERFVNVTSHPSISLSATYHQRTRYLPSPRQPGCDYISPSRSATSPPFSPCSVVISSSIPACHTRAPNLLSAPLDKWSAQHTHQRLAVLHMQIRTASLVKTSQFHIFPNTEEASHVTSTQTPSPPNNPQKNGRRPREILARRYVSLHTSDATMIESASYSINFHSFPHPCFKLGMGIGVGERGEVDL